MILKAKGTNAKSQVRTGTTKAREEYSGISKNQVILHESVTREYTDSSTVERMGNPLKNYIT